MPSFDRAARTGHKVSGGGGGGRGGVAFFRRFFTTAVINTVMAITKSDVDGSSAHNVSSDGQVASGGDMGSLRQFSAAGGHRLARSCWHQGLATVQPLAGRATRLRAYSAGQSRLRDLAASKTLASRARRSGSLPCGLEALIVWNCNFLVALSTRVKRCY